jgi:hypothetical protein
MLLNTKQVRALARNVSNVSASYTDKTIKKDKTDKRRSVVFCFSDAQDADMLANYLRTNCANEVTQTCVARDYITRTWGGTYVRVKADLA